MTNKETIECAECLKNNQTINFNDLKPVGDIAIGVFRRIRHLPSAQKKGKWILIKGSNGKDYHKCSECLHTQEITGVKNYCAVCGARMVSE